ncbi:hypothetical protein GCM10010911_62640 [Paenibacillus nasutitermitis]|uniref:Uncharacterized protein n=1 Tax=Paenibacillus nasutitermitis TaxID=1652958 RepID=A0A916ZG91_9BACL|nr:hypothetical protein GCM10010911_62640 [Paenibacillus nasutitermitis]
MDKCYNGMRKGNQITEGENGITYYNCIGNWFGGYDWEPIFDVKEDGGN